MLGALRAGVLPCGTRWPTTGEGRSQPSWVTLTVVGQRLPSHSLPRSLLTQHVHTQATRAHTHPTCVWHRTGPLTCNTCSRCPCTENACAHAVLIPFTHQYAQEHSPHPVCKDLRAPPPGGSAHPSTCSPLAGWAGRLATPLGPQPRLEQPSAGGAHGGPCAPPGTGLVLACRNSAWTPRKGVGTMSPTSPRSKPPSLWAWPGLAGSAFWSEVRITSQEGCFLALERGSGLGVWGIGRVASPLRGPLSCLPHDQSHC